MNASLPEFAFARVSVGFAFDTVSVIDFAFVVVAVAAEFEFAGVGPKEMGHPWVAQGYSPSFQTHECFPPELCLFSITNPQNDIYEPGPPDPTCKFEAAEPDPRACI
jgi:hypothetical protein